MSDGYNFGANYLLTEQVEFAADNNRILKDITQLEDIANSEMKSLIERIRWRQEQDRVTSDQRLRLWSLIREGYCERCGDRLPCQCGGQYNPEWGVAGEKSDVHFQTAQGTFTHSPEFVSACLKCRAVNTWQCGNPPKYCVNCGTAWGTGSGERQSEEKAFSKTLPEPKSLFPNINALELAELRTKLEQATRTMADYFRRQIELERDVACEAERADLAIQALREVCKCPTCEGTGLFTPECHACLSGEPDHCECANEKTETCPHCDGKKLLFLENQNVAALIGKEVK